MAFIVMRHGAGTPALDREARLCAIKGLNLTLLIGAEHHGMLRWIDVESNDVVKFLCEKWIVAQFERSDKMWLETVCAPDTAYRRGTHAGRFGHAVLTPMRLTGRRLLRRLVNDALHEFGADYRFATGSRRIAFDSREFLRRVTPAPPPDQRKTDLQAMGNLKILQTALSEKHDVGALN